MKGFFLSLSILLICFLFLSILAVDFPRYEIERTNYILNEKDLNTTVKINNESINISEVI
ncbi:hypothetical protein KO465_00625 [Candidatus Micrarchaeota archaeon]|nr:hypothetical protein [Candidatus Micrarchaeota archaeon]